MMDFCPSCGGIKSMSPDINLMNAHNRMCRCPQSETQLATADFSSSGTVTWNGVGDLTEEIRKIVRDEVAKALADVKQEIAREAPQEIAKQVRSKNGVRNNK